MRLSRRFARTGQTNELTLERARLERAGRPVTDLTDSNPTHFGLGSQAVSDAVARAAAAARVYQPDPKGPPVAREALAARFGGSPDHYWLTASTSEAYSWLFAVLADPGEQVAAPAPGYPLIDPLARLADLRVREVRWHYLEPDGWCLDPMTVKRSAELGVKAFVLINPGNPTGAYVDPATRDLFVEACRTARAALISDEVFGPFHLEGRPTTLAGCDQVVTFTLGGLSKLLCAPGLKLGWIRLSGPNDQVKAVGEALDQVADTFLSVNSPVALALPELLELSGPVVERTRRRLEANLTALRQVLGQEPFRVRRCDGGWSGIVDLPREPADPALGADPTVWLVRQAGLAVHPGWFYDIADHPALVLSLLPETDDFQDRCHRLRAALETLLAPGRLGRPSPAPGVKDPGQPSRRGSDKAVPKPRSGLARRSNGPRSRRRP
ncbi:MAG: pyridoxal phosphate-dependent aminotransferase [Bifidobacteriaceae bacterium]|nr:pyridoxal phosphate-dependent aminotransferase [Bifidobacteriaceae bacterium]